VIFFMVTKVQEALAKLLMPDEPLLVGVSGGPDSVALLDALVKCGCSPHICHLNHQLRGAESDADAEFVRQLATHYGLPNTIESRKVASDEDSARRARHGFFAQVSAATGIKKIALAHTADDQVETFLLRLLRGAGVPGLVGIWPERQLGPIRVIRPMLKVRRAEVLEYLREQGLKYREDASNADTRFARNRIRHDLLPLLECQYNPAIRDTLLRTAEILRDEDFYLLQHVAQRFYMSVCQDDAVNVKALANCPVAIQRRLLRFWLGGDSEAGPSFGFEQIEAIRELAASESPSAEVHLPDEWIVYRDYDELKKVQRAELSPVTGKWQVNLEEETVIRELGISILCQPARVGESLRPVATGMSLPQKAKNEEQIDADALGDSPFIRTWQEGDRFQPLGMTETKKLHDFFVDEKVPRRSRGRIPLLCAADGRIAWVVGYRIAEPFKVTERTQNVLRIKCLPQTD
jgi:tRNA(Ile)-lysidine synthase